MTEANNNSWQLGSISRGTANAINNLCHCTLYI